MCQRLGGCTFPRAVRAPRCGEHHCDRRRPALATARQPRCTETGAGRQPSVRAGRCNWSGAVRRWPPWRAAALRSDSARAVPPRQWRRRKRTDLMGRSLASSDTGRGHDGCTGHPYATQAHWYLLRRNPAARLRRPCVVTSVRQRKRAGIEYRPILPDRRQSHIHGYPIRRRLVRISPDRHAGGKGQGT